MSDLPLSPTSARPSDPVQAEILGTRSSLPTAPPSGAHLETAWDLAKQHFTVPAVDIGTAAALVPLGMVLRGDLNNLPTALAFVGAVAFVCDAVIRVREARAALGFYTVKIPEP